MKSAAGLDDRGDTFSPSTLTKSDSIEKRVELLTSHLSCLLTTLKPAANMFNAGFVRLMSRNEAENITGSHIQNHDRDNGVIFRVSNTQPTQLVASYRTEISVKFEMPTNENLNSKNNTYTKDKYFIFSENPSRLDSITITGKIPNRQFTQTPIDISTSELDAVSHIDDAYAKIKKIHELAYEKMSIGMYKPTHILLNGTTDIPIAAPAQHNPILAFQGQNKYDFYLSSKESLGKYKDQLLPDHSPLLGNVSFKEAISEEYASNRIKRSEASNNSYASAYCVRELTDDLSEDIDNEIDKAKEDIASFVISKPNQSTAALVSGKLRFVISPSAPDPIAPTATVSRPAIIIAPLNSASQTVNNNNAPTKPTINFKR
jgi:hypothetical protein